MTTAGPKKRMRQSTDAYRCVFPAAGRWGHFLRDPTFNTVDRSCVVHRHGSVEEADRAGELAAGVVPFFLRDPQHAGDVVKPLALRPQSGAVRRHPLCDILPVDLPGHTDVVRVEPAGQANQGLLPLVVLQVATLSRRRWKHLNGRLFDGYPRFYRGKTHKPARLSVPVTRNGKTAATANVTW